LSLKFKFYALTILLHAVLLVSAYFYLGEDKLEFVAVELFLLSSLFLFLSLVKKVLAPFEFVDLFSDVLHEQEFTTRFSHTGNRELDNLMSLFNQMLGQLYDERLRLGDRKGMLQQLMDAIPLSIIVFDYNNQISQLNPAAESLFNCRSDDLKNKYLNSIEHPLIDNLENLSPEYSQLLSDNKGRRFRCQRSLFRDRGFDRQFIIIQELTSELQSSERKTYEKLIRMMSHEVNNTMAATSSLLESCLHYSDQIDPEERDDYKTAMQLVIERTNNLNQFMQEYAQLVRLPKPSLESCNLRHLLLSIKRLFESKLNNNNIDLILPDSDGIDSQIEADQNQIEQVLINIIKNAVEAIDQEGEINITFITNKADLKLLVKDTGKGISEESQQSMFTPFFTTKVEGQGIGLMLVREILEAHHFEFSLYNRTQRGACFEINFCKPRDNTY